MTLQPLNNTTITHRTTYPERIVQFGAGNFLRAFVDWMVQELNEQTDFASGVVVVKVTPNTTYEALDTQDGMFHVLLQGVQNGELVSQVKRVDCVQRTVYPYHNFDAYLALATQPDIRFLISNTTEAGIAYDGTDQRTDTPPASFPAKLTMFLHHRYQHFNGAVDKGCVVLPTELVSNNGDQLKGFALQYAQQWGLDTGFIHWINNHNLFCNTLVDRIVPGYPTDQANRVQQQIGFEDALLVAGEPYHSWIIEAPDSLNDEIPIKQTDLNVKIVPDAIPYRETKVRILNGAHTSIAMLGPLMGLETVRNCIEHDVMGKFLQDLVYKEIIPAMDFPDDELHTFANDVFDRFRNPHIHHRLLSIALNTGAKVKARILPSLLDYHQKHGELPARLMLALAAYIRFYKGDQFALTDDADIVAAFERYWSQATSTQALANTVLQDTSLWERDLTQIDGLSPSIANYLSDMETIGSQAIIEQINT